MYIYIDNDDNVAPLETNDEVLLSATCMVCGDTYTLPVEDWIDIVVNSHVPCECGADIEIDFLSLDF